MPIASPSPMWASRWLYEPLPPDPHDTTRRIRDGAAEWEMRPLKVAVMTAPHALRFDLVPAKRMVNQWFAFRAVVFFNRTDRPA